MVLKETETASSETDLDSCDTKLSNRYIIGTARYLSLLVATEVLWTSIANWAKSRLISPQYT